MLVPLKGNYKIKDFLSLPEIVFMLVFICIFGLIIYIDSYFPKHNISIIKDSEVINIKTNASTVREALNEAGITLDSYCMVIPSVEERLENGDTIQVIRKDFRTVMEEEDILPPPPIIKKTDSISVGINKIIRVARKGIKRKYFLETYYNGKLAKKSIISEKIIMKPRREIALIGIGKHSKQLYLKNMKGIDRPTVSASKDIAPEDSIIYIPKYGYFRVTNISSSSVPELGKKTRVDLENRAYFLK